ncbi:hypothetical protein [Marinococcus sp. PL1-022]|uniref:Cap15 family cyclic dinucleotide receptor domain-containing protein n=1 Tax=Marinococcus sp. PL1-022 TaxID=3095363 RepID=UPI0029C31B62|nr:hypothetical protein [Marinococcus sp. PL1-022]MDX6154466.1 hypothetical protein [Marinococcus sp. PL1-022]
MYNKTLHARIFYFIVGLVFIAIWFMRGFEGSISIIFISIFSAGGITITLDHIVLRKIIWKKWPNLLKFLVPIPYLGGEWKGILKSSYVDPETQEKAGMIEARIKITHDFDSIHVFHETNQSYSSSYMSGIVEQGPNSSESEKFLYYLFANNADKNRDKNPPHEGTVKLRIKTEENGDLKLMGHYWTNRKTIGEICFYRETTKSSR